jgi:hypothetical protein
MHDHWEKSPPRAGSPAAGAQKPEPVEVPDHRGGVTGAPRAEIKHKKRRRRRSSKELPVRELVSLALIAIILIAASYIAFKLIK